MYIAKGETPCRRKNPELWFAKEKTKRTARAKELCLSCDERLDCLASTLRFEKREVEANGWGAGVQPCVLGGLTQSERAQLLSKSNVVAQATA